MFFFKKMLLKSLWIFAPIVFLCFYGCEQTIDQEEFPYQRRIVVRGLIEEGKPIQDIYIGRTIPIGVAFQKPFADLTDAIAAIKMADTTIILKHTHDGLYSPINLTATAGKTYTIIVQWQDLLASGTTVVPNPPGIARLQLIRKADSLSGFYNVLMAEVFSDIVLSYAATWINSTLNGQISMEAASFSSVVKASSTLSGENVRVESIKIPQSLIGTTGLGIKVFAYDPSFYYYMATQGSGQLSDAIFGQPSQNVIWNIKGDGIGMFIGRANSIKLFSQN